MYQLTKNSKMTKFDKNGVNFVGFCEVWKS